MRTFQDCELSSIEEAARKSGKQALERLGKKSCGESKKENVDQGSHRALRERPQVGRFTQANLETRHREAIKLIDGDRNRTRLQSPLPKPGYIEPAKSGGRIREKFSVRPFDSCTLETPLNLPSFATDFVNSDGDNDDVTPLIEKQGLSITEACARFWPREDQNLRGDQRRTTRGPKIWQAHNYFAGGSNTLPDRAARDERSC